MTVKKPSHTVRDTSRWKALSSFIVAVLAMVLDGALMGLIAPAVLQRSWG